MKSHLIDVPLLIPIYSQLDKRVAAICSGNVRKYAGGTSTVDCLAVFSRSAGGRRKRRLLMSEMPATLLDQIIRNIQLVFRSVLN